MAMLLKLLQWVFELWFHFNITSDILKWLKFNWSFQDDIALMTQVNIHSLQPFNVRQKKKTNKSVFLSTAFI